METKQKNKQTNKKNYVDIGWLWRLGKREAVFGKEYEEREREREREREKTKKSKKPRKLIFFHYAKNGLEFNDEGERKNILN